jgi:hypothetical protein
MGGYMSLEIFGDGRIKLAGNTVIEMSATESTFKVARPFLENPVTVTEDYTLSSNTNAMSAGPITIANNVTVTVSANSEWTVV